MWLPPFIVKIDNRVDNLVNCEYLVRAYIYIAREYKQPK